MIVQCDKCETTFRIADDKVTGIGVKVRCSNCAHVFVVRKDLLDAGGNTVKLAVDRLSESSPTHNDRFPASRPFSDITTEEMKVPRAKRDPFQEFAALSTQESFSKVPSWPGYFPPPPLSMTEPFKKPPSDPVAGLKLLAPPVCESFQNPVAPDLLHRGILHADSNLDDRPLERAEDDPFAEIDIEAPLFFGDDDSFNDPAPSMPSAAPLEPLARIQLGSVSARAGIHANTPVAEAYRDAEEEENGIGIWPTFLGAAIGAAIGLVIVLFLFPSLFPGLIGDWMDLRLGTPPAPTEKVAPRETRLHQPIWRTRRLVQRQERSPHTGSGSVGQRAQRERQDRGAQARMGRRGSRRGDAR